MGDPNGGARVPYAAAVRVLFIGDIVGGPGRRGLAAAMPELSDRWSPDLVIANGENSAGGLGITERTANQIFATGVDVITTGNHVYRHRDAYPFLDQCERVVRPANYPPGNPGRGRTIVESAGMRVGVLNLSGAVQLNVSRSPFSEADVQLQRLSEEGAEAVIVDFHAEVTSEKVAMGWHLDGRVAACLGTHTHVPTADARVLSGGTAFISDVGMTGARNSVLGVRREQALEAFRTQMPIRFTTADDDVWIQAVVVEVGKDGLAERIEQVMLAAPG
jgi:metallophosphoesterase (TIGR00282 family)